MDEKKKHFNLADALKNVSDSDTFLAGREQIEYIDVDLIDGDPANFYELSEIDSLAANIELIGLQQPLRVRVNPEQPDRVIVVSGHRRREAILKLVSEGKKDLRKIPCIRDQSSASSAMQELRLIYANSDTRKMKAADISKQAERVEILLYQLKEEGYEFPGRMRDHVAEACKVSKTKLARLKVIRDGLADVWEKHFESGDLGESVAYALAQMPNAHQQLIFSSWFGRGKSPRSLYEQTTKEFGKRLAKLDNLHCKKCNSPCQNYEGKSHKALTAEYWCIFTCADKCCAKCSDLGRCKYACPNLSDQVKKIKADAKEQRKQEAIAKEAEERPVIQKIQALWNRFGEARNAAGVSVKAVYSALNRYYGSHYDDEVVKKECLEDKFTISTELPYGYGCKLEDIDKLVRVADLFGCSLDYLFCRTDDPGRALSPAQPVQVVDISSVKVIPGMWYPKSVEPPIGQKIIVIDNTPFAEDTAYLGAGTLEEFSCALWSDVVWWSLFPTAGTDTPAQELFFLRWLPGSEPPTHPTCAVAKFLMEGMTKPLRKIVKWDGCSWTFPGGSTIDAPCIGWFPLPEDDNLGL